MIKLKNKFRFNANDIEVIERYDNLLLAKIQPDFGPAYYDISTVQLDGYGDEQFYPSMNGNGLRTELVEGGPREPKSFEEMQTAFDDLVTAAKKRAIAASEARESAIRREQEFINRKLKGQAVKERSKAIADELRELAVEAGDVDTFIGNKRVQKLAMQFYMIEIFKQFI